MEGRTMNLSELRELWPPPRPGGRLSRDAVGAWAEHAARSAALGAVADENLCALLGRRYRPARAWWQARASFEVLLERLRGADTPLVLKLVVPLRPASAVEPQPAGDAAIAAEVHPAIPPSLVVHPPGVTPGWEEAGQLRVACPSTPFVDVTGAARADALYVAFRPPGETEYRRSLVFERVQA
ncbi:MAG: hypothetical protein QOE28_2362 [Solirubrobacteraceae bacterium]|jgi:hypothetical protein|nr:hypothetical protein [Solirubrobacteraceae bacterium]